MMMMMMMMMMIQMMMMMMLMMMMMMPMMMPMMMMLARERKAQFADWQRQNKARASDCLSIPQLAFFQDLEKKLKDAQQRAAPCMFLTFKRHNCTLLLQGSYRIADRGHGGAQTAFQEGQGGHLFSSLLHLPILKLRRLSSRAPTDAVALAKKHDVSSRRVWHACAFDGSLTCWSCC